MTEYGAILTLARHRARKVIKERWRASGQHPYDLRISELHLRAEDYLSAHPELFEKAAETVRNDPHFRTLAERKARQRKGNQR